MICYLATAQDGRRYVGITSQSLQVRRSQHERTARNGKGSVFHMALREFGPESFVWEILAEGREDVIKALEGALISRWGLAGWEKGFNGKGGLYDLGDEPPEIMDGFRDFEHERDWFIAEAHLTYDLERVVNYIEKNASSTLVEASNDLRKLGTRLVERADQLNEQQRENTAQMGLTPYQASSNRSQ